MTAIARDAAQARAVDFDIARLRAYLDALLGASSAPLEVVRTEGGMSNPTYFLQRGSWQAVLRKQPSAVRQYDILAEGLVGAIADRCVRHFTV